MKLFIFYCVCACVYFMNMCAYITNNHKINVLKNREKGTKIIGLI